MEPESPKNGRHLDAPGWVYFIRSPINGLVKIGYTASHPRGRFRRLAATCPVALEPMALRRGSLETERLYHARFAALWSHGEWFRIASEIEAEVAASCEPWEDEGPAFRRRPSNPDRRRVKPAILHLQAPRVEIESRDLVRSAKEIKSADATTRGVETRRRKRLRRYARETLYITREPRTVRFWADRLGVSVGQMWDWRVAGVLRKRIEALLANLQPAD
jgi:hypothetical protein